MAASTGRTGSQTEWQSVRAVLALAAPQAEPLLLEARLLTSGDTRASCRVAAAMARVQSEVARSEAGIGRFEAMSAREQAQLARIEANRARIEARVARMRIPAVAVDPAVFHAAPVFPVCSRVRVNIPRMPKLTMPTVPVIHVKAPSAGPV